MATIKPTGLLANFPAVQAAARLLNALASLRVSVRLNGRQSSAIVGVAGDSAAAQIDLAPLLPNAQALALIADDGTGGMLYNGVPVGAGDGPVPLFAFSETGVGGWHASPTSNDYYLRYSTNSGATWSAAILWRTPDTRASLTLAHTDPLNLTFTLATEFRVTPVGPSLNITASAFANMDVRELFVFAAENDVAVTMPASWQAYEAPLTAIPAGRECCVVLKALGTSQSDMRYSWRLTA